MWNPPLASDGVEDGVLVRFWFPPYLNERHLQVYPLLINVVSVNGMQAPGQERLLDELAVFLSASLNVITMRVQNWIGRALIRVIKEGIDGEIFNYRLLLQSLKDHYYYIRWDNIGLVGAHGIHAHLAGLLLREEWMPLNLTCAALLSPVVSWALQGFQDAARVFDPRDEYKHLEYDLTKWTHLYRNKDIFLIYGTADTIVPYQSTAKFVSALAEKGVQYSMLPLFDADHEYAERQDLKESLLTRLSVFLCDCLRSKDTARANLYRRLHMEGPA
ncbi:unnamed protein product [Dicrocoelium dendriticum]|nr:unnamed protein product [Dicrocoelium dendriticum]